jgi:cAMP-dependent protein kinase regulator
VAVEAQRISEIPLFEGLSDQELAAVAEKLETRDLHPGEHQSSEGGAGYFFFIIESGHAEVVKHGEKVAELEPGDFFGEGAIFRARRRTATVTATQPGLVFAMFGADFAKLVGDIPELHERINAALDARLPAD